MAELVMAELVMAELVMAELVMAELVMAELFNCTNANTQKIKIDIWRSPSDYFWAITTFGSYSLGW